MSRTLGRPVGRVDENIENIIFDYIEKQIESDSPEKAEIRQNKLDEFRKQLKTVRRPTYRSITYETLPTLLSIANLNIKDMYRLAGVEISWLSDEMQELCEASDKLDAKERIRIMNQAIELSPDFWHDSEMLNNQPTTRAINLLWRCNNRSGRRTLEGSLTTPALAKSYSDRKNTTPLSILDLPDVAKCFQISLHWLLKQGGLLDVTRGIDGKIPTTVMAENEETEVLLDAYLFMPTTVRSAFKNMVINLSRKENDKH